VASPRLPASRNGLAHRVTRSFPDGESPSEPPNQKGIVRCSTNSTTTFNWPRSASGMPASGPMSNDHGCSAMLVDDIDSGRVNAGIERSSARDL